MQTVQFLTKKDVEQIVALAVSKKADAIARQIMKALEQRVPDPGPKTLKDEESIDLLGLSVRAHNVLVNAGIETIGQLVSLKRRELCRMRGFGRATHIELQTRLARHGRRLSPNL